MAVMVLIRCNNSNENGIRSSIRESMECHSFAGQAGTLRQESRVGRNGHNYDGAVVLGCDRESIRLLFKSQLPENLELKFGERHFIDGLGKATYSKAWRGCWIHDFALRPEEMK